MTSNNKKTGTLADPVQGVLTYCGKLTKEQIKQLLQYLPQMLADWEEEEQKIAQTNTPTPGSLTPGGRRRGTYVEWKDIKRNGKTYGPYPYWRYRESKVYKSVYMKELAQAARSQST